MHKELLVPFINAGAEVLFELLGEKVKPGEVKVIDKITDSQGIAVIIGITGDLEGRIIIDLASDTGHKISESILSETIDVNDVELIESAIGELGNMIVGRAISMLNEMEFHLKITPPTIFKGTNMKVIDKNSKMLVVPLGTQIGTFVLNLSIKKAK